MNKQIYHLFYINIFFTNFERNSNHNRTQGIRSVDQLASSTKSIPLEETLAYDIAHLFPLDKL